MFEKNKVWKNIEHELFPEPQPVFIVGKIFLFHTLSILVVLSFCPQFGFGIFNLLGLPQPIDITHYFMLVSHTFCQLACGAVLFVVSSAIIYNRLKMTEKEWLWNQKILIYTLLISLTGGFFIATAPDITILNVIMWTIGAVIGLSINKIAEIRYFFNNNR